MKEAAETWLLGRDKELPEEKSEEEEGNRRAPEYIVTLRIKASTLPTVEKKAKAAFGEKLVSVEKVGRGFSRAAELAEAEKHVDAAAEIVGELKNGIEEWRDDSRKFQPPRSILFQSLRLWRPNWSSKTTTYTASLSSPIGRRSVVSPDVFVDRRGRIKVVVGDKKSKKALCWGIERDGQIVGVCTFGAPMWSVSAGVTGGAYWDVKLGYGRWYDCLELTRLWVDDSVTEHCIESKFVAWCLREVKKINPNAFIVSYADQPQGTSASSIKHSGSPTRV